MGCISSKTAENALVLGEKVVAENEDDVIEQGENMVSSASNLVQCLDYGVGVGLLELAREIPFIKPLAFMVTAVVKACESSKRLVNDCESFAQCVVEMEKILIENEKHLGNCEETVSKLSMIMQDVMQFISKLQSKSYVNQVLSSESQVLKFTAYRNRMLDLLKVMNLKMTSNMHKMAQVKFQNEQKLNALLLDDNLDIDEAEKLMSGSDRVIMKGNLENNKLMRQSSLSLQKQEIKLSAMKVNVEETQQQMTMSLDKTRVLEIQNEILLKQVQQMQFMMEKQNMMMTQFMQNFPMPINEANRLHKVRTLDLMNLKLPCKNLEDYLDQFLLSLPKEFECIGLITQLMELEDLKPLAFRLKTPEEVFGKGMAQHMEPSLRKVSVCQYVIANDAVTCYDSGCLPPAILDYVQGGDIADNISQLLPKQGAQLQKFVDLWELAKMKMSSKSVEIPPEAKSMTDYMIHCWDNREKMKYMGCPIRIDGESVGLACIFYISDQDREEAVRLANVEHFCEMCANILEKEARK